METRKIQTVGGGTFTVSLPKEWVESQDIATGEMVDLHTHIDGMLVIQTQECEDDTPTRATVEVDHEDSAPLDRLLRAAYAVGAKEVILVAATAFTAEQRRVVERVTRTLPGVSVVEESGTRIRVRIFLDSEEISVQQSVRQLTFIALSRHRDATDALMGDTSLKCRADRDDQADRLYALIDRSFARGLERLDEVDAIGLSRPELFELWATTRELKRVADHAEALIALATGDASGDETPVNDMQGVARRARGIVEDAVSVIVGDSNVETARQALTARDQVREEITTIDRRSAETSTDGDGRRLVLNRVRRTAEHGGNIAELGLRNGIRRGDLTEPMPDPEGNEDRDPESYTSAGTER